jgi:hypothetical protein
LSGEFVIDKLSFPIPVCVQMAICIFYVLMRNTQRIHLDFFFFLTETTNVGEKRRRSYRTTQRHQTRKKEKKKQFLVIQDGSPKAVSVYTFLLYSDFI